MAIDGREGPMQSKADIRESVWETLDTKGLARFPFPPHGRIPNFDGSPAAAERLADRPWWSEAEVIKCNPDAPQRFVREQALAEGRTLLMAQPRLRDERPFIRLDPATIDDPSTAATIGGAAEYGEPLALDSIPIVDAIVSGSVAVDHAGRRIGKGEGYSDLEYAILLELGAIDPSVPIATTVHDVQVFDDPLPMDPHDVALDTVATPTTYFEVEDRPARPTGVDWSGLDDERRSAIPVLKALE